MDNIKRLTKIRTANRTPVTRNINDLKRLLEVTPAATDKLNSKLTFLEAKVSALTQKNQAIEAVLEEELLEEECGACDRYLEAIIAITVQVRSALDSALRTARHRSAESGDVPQAPSTQHSNPTTSADGITLPKLRIDSFSGELSRWQGFWDQFRASIHEYP